MSKNNLRATVIGALSGALGLALIGFYFFTPSPSAPSSSPISSPISKLDITKISAEVFKSPSCGCCNGYIDALKGEGFQVKSVNIDDIATIKNKYKIPASMQSCHTTIIGKYFVEGHVPVEAVKRLLKNNPDIDGIALPGMPVGTPGMPGPKESPFVIYQVKNGQSSEFMKI